MTPPPTLRAFVGGLVHETNTFSPIPTDAASFAAGSVRPVDGRYVEASRIDTLGYGHFARMCLEAGYQLHAGPYSHTGPSAALSARSYAVLKDELLADLERALPLDMVFLFMHGAQIAQGCDDVEGDLLAAVRERVGPTVPVAILLDLHANITSAMLRHATFCVGCLEYPHTDYEERAQHVFGLMQAALAGRVQPHTRAWRIPLVGIYRTVDGPMKAFVDRLRDAQHTPGVLSISAFHGFPMGDTPHTGAMLVLTSDGAATELNALGAALAQQFIDAALATPMPVGLQAALDDALRADDAGRGPVVFADGHDKVGRLDAISVETGKTMWSWETMASNYSPVLATAGGLLFNGGMDRYLRAFDQTNGKVLWQTRLGSQVFGATTTFRVAGRQYIAVAAGGGYNPHPLPLTTGIDQPAGGNMVYVFALPE